MSEILISSASNSNYEGMVALVSVDGGVYLGKTEHYHFTPGMEIPTYYDNSDGSLQFVSDNVKMFHFLYGEGWPLSQRKMLWQGFTRSDYAEFARLRVGVLARYPQIREITFAGQPFCPPKSLSRTHFKRYAPAR